MKTEYGDELSFTMKPMQTTPRTTTLVIIGNVSDDRYTGDGICHGNNTVYRI